MNRYVGCGAHFCALIGITFFVIACGKQGNNSNQSLPAPSASIVTETSEYTPVVMVSLPGGSGICTGTFISPKAVLTAAHCLKGAGRYTVYSAVGNFGTTTKFSYGSGLVNDPNDIGLLIFDNNVVSSAHIYGLGNSVSSGDTLRLVGYGCTNLDTRRGAGSKRTGTNVVDSINDYINFMTPSNTMVAFGHNIIGSSNRAGSCFGDSGGPALKQTIGGGYVVVGVTHAGGYMGDDIISEYIDVARRNDNRNFISNLNTTYNLGIQGL